MCTFSSNSKQILVIYSDNLIDKNNISIFKLYKSDIRVINISVEELSDIIWLEILDNLKFEFKDLLETDTMLNSNEKTEEFTNADWLKLTKEHKAFLKFPLIIKQGKVNILDRDAEKNLISHRSRLKKYPDRKTKKINTAI